MTRVSGDAIRRPAMRFLVCPQEFKGTLDAHGAAEAIAAGILRAFPDAEVARRPMADGGPGTRDVIAAATGARLFEVTAQDAYGAPIVASYAITEAPHGTTAIIEAAAAVSLAATPEARRRPMRSTSRGVGELIAAAIDRGATEVILGVGGTASSDGGAGAAASLGLRLLDANGATLPDEAAHLVRLAHVEDAVPAAWEDVRVRIAVDVRNPLTGPDGAVAVFGAQKGLRDWEAPALDAAIRHWACCVREDLGREIESAPGSGAGGGIPAGVLAALPAATLESGAALVADAIGLREAMMGMDAVITGEGSLDAQTAFGKAVAHVTALAAEAGVPCLAVAGLVESVPDGIADAEPLATDATSSAAAMAEPQAHITAATERLVRRWIESHGA